MNKIIKKIVETVPNPEIDIKTYYKLIRTVYNFFRKPKLKPLYKIMDINIKIKGYSVPVRAFYPKLEGPHAVIIFYHGGGWVTGNIDTYSKLCKDLANATNRIVLSVDYRLSPEYKFPTPFLDCYGVTKYVYNNANVLNIKKSDIVIMGDSAGANIAACVSLKARNNMSFKVKKQILIYPPVIADHSKNTYKSLEDNKNNITLSLKQLNSYIDLYMSKEKDLKNPYFAPMNSKNLKNLPETLIITAEFDILRDEGEDFGKRLKQAGNKVSITRIEGIGHGFLSMKGLKETKQTYETINEFLGENNE